MTRTAALSDTVTPSKGPFPLRHYEHAHLLSNIEKLPLPIWGTEYHDVPFLRLEPNRSFPSVCYTHT